MQNGELFEQMTMQTILALVMAKNFSFKLRTLHAIMDKCPACYHSDEPL
jgi:hypothetical protein